MDVFGAGSLASYANLDQIGEGTYGYVYRATSKGTGEIVALKRLILYRDQSGFPLHSVREIKLLKSLQHKNIVKLHDVVTSKGCDHLELPIVEREDTKEMIEQSERRKRKLFTFPDELRLMGSLYLVFEFVEHDLGGLMDAKYKFSTRAIKSITKQLFEVLDFLNEKKVLHRDIKCSNILISNRHQIKLADFGLARYVSEQKRDLTNNVVTMWYKAPELLLGAVRYTSAVDMWSAGCVLAELELGRPLFPGKTEAEQMDLICRTISTPREENWANVSKLSNYDNMMKDAVQCTTSLTTVYADKLTEATLGLLERVLVLDPLRRSSAKIALSNKFFLAPPLPPIDPTELGPLNVSSGTSFHEYKTRLLRKQKTATDAAAASSTASTDVSSRGTVAGVVAPGLSTSNSSIHSALCDLPNSFSAGIAPDRNGSFVPPPPMMTGSAEPAMTAAGTAANIAATLAGYGGTVRAVGNPFTGNVSAVTSFSSSGMDTGAPPLPLPPPPPQQQQQQCDYDHYQAPPPPPALRLFPPAPPPPMMVPSSLKAVGGSRAGAGTSGPPPPRPEQPGIVSGSSSSSSSYNNYSSRNGYNLDTAPPVPYGHPYQYSHHQYLPQHQRDKHPTFGALRYGEEREWGERAIVGVTGGDRERERGRERGDYSFGGYLNSSQGQQHSTGGYGYQHQQQQQALLPPHSHYQNHSQNNPYPPHHHHHHHQQQQQQNPAPSFHERGYPGDASRGGSRGNISSGIKKNNNNNNNNSNSIGAYGPG